MFANFTTPTKIRSGAVTVGAHDIAFRDLRLDGGPPEIAHTCDIVDLHRRVSMIELHAVERKFPTAIDAWHLSGRTDEGRLLDPLHGIPSGVLRLVVSVVFAGSRPNYCSSLLLVFDHAQR